jgi:hypothetical protein
MSIWIEKPNAISSSWSTRQRKQCDFQEAKHSILWDGWSCWLGNVKVTSATHAGKCKIYTFSQLIWLKLVLLDQMMHAGDRGVCSYSISLASNVKQTYKNIITLARCVLTTEFT